MKTWLPTLLRTLLVSLHLGAALVPGLAAAQAADGAAPLRGPGAVALRNQPQRTGPAGHEAMARVAPADEHQLALGARIYREGRGEGGREVMGLRFGGVEAQGAAVACATCHRRSGLGAVEGVDQVAPVAGRIIFTDDPRAVVSMNYRNIKSFNQRHAPFDDGSFAAAVNGGAHVDGRELSPMMPRFDLRPAELQALQAYLRTLSAQWSPGVSATRLRLATVITPDTTPERREIFLETLRAAVSQKNGNFTPGQRTMSTAAEMLFRSDRFWDLDVWTLSGPPSTWGEQLDAHMRRQPVFALVSGLGAGEWGPVHAFCEREQTPCWFPSVDAPPPEAQKDFYSLYFSAGVLLEADVLARHLSAGPRPARVVQLHRGDAAGRAATERLRAALSRLKTPPQLLTREVKGDAPAELRRALQGLDRRDVVVMWWPGEQMAALQPVEPPGVSAVYASARLLGAQPEQLPATWKTALQIVSPYQVPEQRHATLFHFEAWLKIRRIALRDLALQSEVYFATSYLAETLTDMIDNVHRDYLVERAENMLSLREGQKAEDEARGLATARHHKAEGGTQGAVARLAAGQSQFRKSVRPMPGLQAHTGVKREGTSVYPRLSLAQGQRFASKGAYLVRFADAAASEVQAASDWIVP
ncbi:MAG: hypothetical protein JNM33_02960 [Rubrivivax sp.]|nr:hypothetical protein [Rubrivivax sp.]